MAASHLLTKRDSNKAYHAHSFIDFEAATIPGGAVSGTVIGVTVQTTDEDNVEVDAAAAYSFEAPGAASADTDIYEACKALAVLITAGITGNAWATRTSRHTCRINVLANAGAEHAILTSAVYTAAV